MRGAALAIVFLAAPFHGQAAERPPGLDLFERLCPGLVEGSVEGVALGAPLKRREGAQDPFNDATVAQMVATLGADALGTEVEAVTAVAGERLYASSDPEPTPAFANLFLISGMVTGEPVAPSAGLKVATCGLGSTVAKVEHPSEEAFRDRFVKALTPLAADLGAEVTLSESGGWNAERSVFNWSWHAESATGALDGFAEYKPGDDWVGLSVGATLITREETAQ
ncbi:MAG: hypothetical protein AAF698_05065 [Pseudomonadota bacterium]